jgi:transposase
VLGVGRFWIGIDVGKKFHWACVLDDDGEEVLSCRIEAAEEDLEAFCSRIASLDGERKVAIDLLGGPATTLEVSLLTNGERVFYVSGLTVNRARDAYRGGEHKSDPRDARVIADQLRMRWKTLSEVKPRDGAVAEMRVLVAHRRDLVQDQNRRIARLRALLLEVFPGLEAALDLTKEGPLITVTKVATPKTARRLGEARLARWLKARGVRKAEELAQKTAAAAKAQRRELPAAEAKAELVAEIASEVLKTKERLKVLGVRLEELVERSPEATVVRSLPGMGPVFAAEFVSEVGDIDRFRSADQLAAAAGLTPVLRASGQVSFQRRSRRRNAVLKRVLYRSAFTAMVHHEASRAFYCRKRDEGKTHRQSLIALARRRVNVLWAMLRDGRLYEEQTSRAA